MIRCYVVLLMRGSMNHLNVHFLPALTTPDELAGSTVVVIDVLRATTTIVYALAAGAREVLPCLEVDEARQRAAALPTGQAVLGGERGGLRIDGFDLGNSPEEYAPQVVQGRTVLLTTTNGTRAMLGCRTAARVLIGAFVNAPAVARELAPARRIDLVCAGTRGAITRDDVLLAGYLTELAMLETLPADLPGEPWQLNDQARLASNAWRACSVTDDELLPAESLEQQLRHSQGGRDLIAIGFDRDIAAAARIGQFDLVPELDVTRSVITLAPVRSPWACDPGKCDRTGHSRRPAG